jgi:hypothetical protein
MPTGSQDKLAHCRGVRRMHLRTNVPACVRAPGSHLRLICAWLIATRKLSVIRLVEIVTFLRYTPSKRSVLLWVEIFMTLSTIWQMY